MARGASSVQSGARRAGSDQEDASGKATLLEGVLEGLPGAAEAPLSGAEVQSGAFSSRMVTDDELASQGIVKGGDGRYYQASPGQGGSIVLRPVDPKVAAAAAKMGLDISVAISEATTEQSISST